MSEGYKDTPKQREIMNLVLDAVAKGAFISQSELKASLSYGADVSNAAINCSMKILAKHGMIERVMEGTRARYRPTRLAYLKYRRI